MSTNPNRKKTTSPRPRRIFPAKVKCEAVLAVWAERRTPSEICRDLGIPWQQLQSWQSQAMAAMMASLEPRTEEPEQAVMKQQLAAQVALLRSEEVPIVLQVGAAGAGGDARGPRRAKPGPPEKTTRP